MSRVSDTRQRTREAAAHLVANGKRPHEITVDLIYAQIQQGSRTTINDELKAWRHERTKVDALGAELPPTIAESMRSLWASAIENGEAVFAQQRDALETERTQAVEAAEAAVRARVTLQTDLERAQQQVAALREQLDDVQRRLNAEIADKQALSDELRDLRHATAIAREESIQQLAILRHEQEQKTREYQAALQTRDTAFRAELDTATQRLTSVENHMLQQIDDARTAQRRAEARVAETQQRADALTDNVTTLRLQFAAEQKATERYRQMAERAALELTSTQGELAQLRTDHAESRGRLAVQADQLGAWEARALKAEQGLLNALSQRLGKRVTRRAKSVSPPATPTP